MTCLDSYRVRSYMWLPRWQACCGTLCQQFEFARGHDPHLACIASLPAVQPYHNYVTHFKECDSFMSVYEPILYDHQVDLVGLLVEAACQCLLAGWLAGWLAGRPTGWGGAQVAAAVCCRGWCRGV